MFNPVEKRLHFRVPLHAAITVDADTQGGVSVELLNASLTGFAIRSTRPISSNALITLQCPGLPALRARALRTDGDTTGCRFERTLHPVHFQHLLMLGAGGSRRALAA